MTSVSIVFHLHTFYLYPHSRPYMVSHLTVIVSQIKDINHRPPVIWDVRINLRPTPFDYMEVKRAGIIWPLHPVKSFYSPDRHFYFHLSRCWFWCSILHLYFIWNSFALCIHLLNLAHYSHKYGCQTVAIFWQKSFLCTLLEHKDVCLWFFTNPNNGIIINMKLYKTCQNGSSYY